MDYKDINSLEDVQTYIQQGNSLNGSQVFALTRKLGRSESVIRDAMEGTLPQDIDTGLARAAAGVDTKAPMSFAEAKRLLNQPVSSGPKTSTPTTKEVQDFSKFGDDAEYVASAVKSLEQAKIPKTLSEGINLLRKYDSPQPISSAEKEVVKTTKDSLNELLSNGTISQGEFNAFSNAIETIDTETVAPTTSTGQAYNAIGQLGPRGQSNEGYEYKFDNPPGRGLNPGVTNIGDPDPEPLDTPQDELGTNTGSGQQANTETIEFNNIPNEGKLWDVEGSLYIVYEVPGANGEVYEGNPIYMAYEVAGNDLVNAGLLTKGETAPQPNAIVDKTFFDNTSVVAGNTQQLSALIENPFASFVETITEQSQVAPWITDPEMISLIAEAAIENREITDAEWQTTNWYQTHNESEREWLRTYYSDPSTATQLTTDSQIAVANSLQAAGVSNAPEALINWVAGKYVSGEWSQTYTTEQISLFADPYATGKRDASFENYLSSTALTGVDRTTEREREVRELYSKWLGPTLGKLTDQETAEIAGRLRDDPDYQDQLVQSLKQSRLAAFSNYTNPELTYEDIARPWRNLTTSVWGQTADETQGWWQEMVKSNDFATAQTTLREKGLEQDVTQVTQDATQALQQALGQGTVSQSGVNV
jgi:hypothetical protein